MRRSIVLWWLIILIDYVRIIQSVGEFINENETEIVSILEPKLLLQQDVTFEGSGVSTEISTMMSEVTGTASQATDYTSVILTSTVDFTLSLSESTSTDTAVTGISEQTVTFGTSVTATPITEFSSTSALIITTITIDDNPSTESSTITFTADSSTSTSITTNTISSIITDISVTTESSTTTISSIITDISVTTDTSATTTTTPYRPDSCTNQNEIKLLNGTCIPTTEATTAVIGALQNSTDSRTIAEALVIYFELGLDRNTSLASNLTLSLARIDKAVDDLNNLTLSGGTDASFIMVQPPNQDGKTISGASFTRKSGGQIVDTSNENNLFNSNISAAAIVSNQSLNDVTSLNMLIIDDPIAFKNIDNSSNKEVASSIIMIALKRNNNAPSTQINISLYFQILNDDIRNRTDVDYYCSFYDASSLKWNESGCAKPESNNQSKLFKCSCNHTTTFALLWSPKTVTTATTTTTTTTTTPTPYRPDSCTNQNETRLLNGTCISNTEVTTAVVGALQNSTNSITIVEALVIYFELGLDRNTSASSNFTLSPARIDELINNLDNVTFSGGTDASFIMVEPPQQPEKLILGASFTRGLGGQIVDTLNQDNVTKHKLSAAAIISNESLNDVTSLKMLIINDSIAFEKIEDPYNRTLVSPIIVVAVKRNNVSSNSSIPSNQFNISLYFQDIRTDKINQKDSYHCSFYDTNNNKSQWNDSGCTSPQYNAQFNRYECSCNHLTSFALLWLPNVPLTRNLSAQDIASIVFQSISIVCFLCIILHAIVIRLLEPLMSLRAFDLLPLISCASTTILFIFYIALGMTTYTRTTDDDGNKCFLSSKVLMFFVYFFVLYMFCVKTSVGYFNYLRFVRLFPEPSRSKLFILLVILFFISITWVAFAAGFDSNPSYNITRLYPYKLCWFTRDVIYYFLTIPACIFLAINAILFLLVARRIIYHVQNATSPHQSYERMKRCVIVLLSSCLTQGIGWLLGPVITVVNPGPGEVLSWIFIIFNGLEGLWSIILYAIIRSQRIDEQKRLVASKELTRSSTLPSFKGKNNRVNDTNRSLSRRFRTTDKNVDKEWNTFNNLHSVDVESDDRSSSIC